MPTIANVNDTLVNNRPVRAMFISGKCQLIVVFQRLQQRGGLRPEINGLIEAALKGLNDDSFKFPGLPLKIAN